MRLTVYFTLKVFSLVCILYYAKEKCKNWLVLFAGGIIVFEIFAPTTAGMDFYGSYDSIQC